MKKITYLIILSVLIGNILLSSESDETIELGEAMERKTVSYEEIAYSNMMSIEALVSLLTRKGLITQQEVLDELKAVRTRDEQERN